MSVTNFCVINVSKIDTELFLYDLLDFFLRYQLLWGKSSQWLDDVHFWYSCSIWERKYQMFSVGLLSWPQRFKPFKIEAGSSICSLRHNFRFSASFVTQKWEFFRHFLRHHQKEEKCVLFSQHGSPGLRRAGLNNGKHLRSNCELENYILNLTNVDQIRQTRQWSNISMKLDPKVVNSRNDKSQGQ